MQCTQYKTDNCKDRSTSSFRLMLARVDCAYCGIHIPSSVVGRLSWRKAFSFGSSLARADGINGETRMDSFGQRSMFLSSVMLGGAKGGPDGRKIGTRSDKRHTLISAQNESKLQRRSIPFAPSTSRSDAVAVMFQRLPSNSRSRTHIFQRHLTNWCEVALKVTNLHKHRSHHRSRSFRCPNHHHNLKPLRHDRNHASNKPTETCESASLQSAAFTAPGIS